MQSVYLYPSLLLIRRNGREPRSGTTKPFQQFGAPSFPDSLYHFIPQPVPGAFKPPLLSQTCYGYDLSGIDVEKTNRHRMSLQWLLKAYSLYPGQKNIFFNGNGVVLTGWRGRRSCGSSFANGLTEDNIRNSWEPALEHFKLIRKKYLLYAE